MSLILSHIGGCCNISYANFISKYGQRSSSIAANFIAMDAAKAESIKIIGEGAAPFCTLAETSAGDLFRSFLYSAGQHANEAVQDQLMALSCSSLAVIFGVGLVTSLSPCTLSVLPLVTTGYVATLLVAASFAGALQSLLSFRKFSAWINPLSGALLLGGGVYTFLDRLFPVTMSA